ncbi:MAG: type II toxin-antitoxin system VapC family toxin [Gammaproteobacteria bacterium]|nr:type II toxin-antitoxin system VapC family toxin [Gammaproteobacteria bacterium]
MRLFFDTSAFIKRYVDEPGSERVLDLTSKAEELGLSVLVLPESISTLRRLLRENQLAEVDYRALKEAILIDLNDADLCDMTPSVLEHAITCLERSPLRALDAVHIGSALVYQPDLFISADRRQIIAAEREGLRVEDLSGTAVTI